MQPERIFSWSILPTIYMYFQHRYEDLCVRKCHSTVNQFMPQVPKDWLQLTLHFHPRPQGQGSVCQKKNQVMWLWPCSEHLTFIHLRSVIAVEVTTILIQLKLVFCFRRSKHTIITVTTKLLGISIIFIVCDNPVCYATQSDFIGFLPLTICKAWQCYTLMLQTTKHSSFGHSLSSHMFANWDRGRGPVVLLPVHCSRQLDCCRSP